MSAPTPHRANVPGDFYVEDGCCTMCGVPFGEAPELFGQCDDSRGYMHCFVKRQPQTTSELSDMLSALQFSEFECIRYRGTDRLIQLKLVELNCGEACDHLPTDLQQRVNRDVWKRRGFLAGLWAELGFGRAPEKPWWKFWR
ncbi:MAG TPA: hypothetical protein VFG20_19765 [Planctomycetaceae bacterium]|nr:hypothetical protein [Planctomycetaceae bacterium]